MRVFRFAVVCTEVRSAVDSRLRGNDVGGCGNDVYGGMAWVCAGVRVRGMT